MGFRYIVYSLVALYIISNFLYRKSVKKLKFLLGYESESSVKIWDLIKEESKKGNKVARFAFVLFFIEIICAFGLVGIISLMNI